MAFPTVSLYLGFPLNEGHLSSLQHVDPALRALFINSSDDYLQEIRYKDTSYLAKAVGIKAPLAQLKLIEVNIYSLLTKIFPDHSCESIPLELFPLHSSTPSQK